MAFPGKAYPFHIVERGLIQAPVVKLGCPRGRMVRHVLGAIEGAAIGEIRRDPVPQKVRLQTAVLRRPFRFASLPKLTRLPPEASLAACFAIILGSSGAAEPSCWDRA